MWRLHVIYSSISYFAQQSVDMVLVFWELRDSVKLGFYNWCLI